VLVLLEKLLKKFHPISYASRSHPLSRSGLLRVGSRDGITNYHNGPQLTLRRTVIKHQKLPDFYFCRYCSYCVRLYADLLSIWLICVAFIHV